MVRDCAEVLALLSGERSYPTPGQLVGGHRRLLRTMLPLVLPLLLRPLGLLVL